MENNENYENNNYSYKNNSCKENECKKFFLIALMAFAGSFLAFYVLMHQTMMFYYNMATKNFMAKNHQFEMKFDKDFKKMKGFADKQFNLFENRISAIQTTKNDNEYVIVIDLKKFNNNENNIRFNINGNIVTVSGNIIKNKKNAESSYYFTESFEVPEKIDMENITKEKINNNYIITLPIEN